MASKERALNAEAREMSLSKAMRQSLLQTAFMELGLVLHTEGIEQNGLRPNEIKEFLEGSSATFECVSDKGAIACIALDPDFLAALLEMQTLGQLKANPAPKRRPTSVDFAIIAPFFESVLAQLTQILQAQKDVASLGCYTPKGLLDDKRDCASYFTHPFYTTIRLNLQLAQTERRGSISFIVPSEPPPKPNVKKTDCHPFLEQGALDIALPVHIELASLELSVKELQKIRKDGLLDLPAKILEKVTLRSETGQVLLRAVLGKKNGNYALQIGDGMKKQAPQKAHVPQEPVAHDAPASMDTTQANPGDNTVFQADEGLSETLSDDIKRMSA